MPFLLEYMNANNDVKTIELLLQYMDADDDVKTMDLLLHLPAPNEMVCPITVERIQ